MDVSGLRNGNSRGSCCVGPIAIAAFWGLVRSFRKFGGRVVSRALYASGRMPAVPATMAKALAREALGWANGLIGFDEQFGYKTDYPGENIVFDVHKTHRQRLIGSTMGCI